MRTPLSAALAAARAPVGIGNLFEESRLGFVATSDPRASPHALVEVQDTAMALKFGTEWPTSQNQQQATQAEL